MRDRDDVQLRGTGTARIAVIEDEPDLLEMLRLALELAGFTVIGIAHPDLAPTMAETIQPDLFLVDVMLPGISGIELAEKLRAKGFTETPMIAMSASKLMSQVAARSGVFQAAIDKPFELARLRRAVEWCLGGASQPGEPR